MTHYICPKCPRVIEEDDLEIYSEKDVDYHEYRCPGCDGTVREMADGLSDLVLMVRAYMDDNSRSGGLIATDQQRRALELLHDCATGEYA